LFQPLVFDDEATASQSLINSERSGIKESLWYRFEPVHRLALRDQGLRAELIHHRDEVEANIYAVVEAKESMAEAWALGEQWHGYWSARVRSLAPRYRWYSAYDRYWKRLNRMDGLDVS
jgi:hypothetical protein